jgi:hypothetical protein
MDCEEHSSGRLRWCTKNGVVGKVTGGEGRLWRLYRKPDFTGTTVGDAAAATIRWTVGGGRRDYPWLFPALSDLVLGAVEP